MSALFPALIAEDATFTGASALNLAVLNLAVPEEAEA